MRYVRRPEYLSSKALTERQNKLIVGNRSRLLSQGMAHINLAAFFVHAKYFAELEAYVAQLRAERLRDMSHFD